MISSKVKKIMAGFIIMFLIGCISGCKNHANQTIVQTSQEKNIGAYQSVEQVNQNKNEEVSREDKQELNQEENYDGEKNHNVITPQDINVIHKYGYYSATINSNEEFTDLLERVRDNNEIEKLSLYINSEIDTFLPEDFTSLTSLKSIQIITLCSLADKMDYLPWFEQNHYDLEIIWDKDEFYKNSDEKPPLPANLRNVPYYEQLTIQPEDYLEVYNKKINGDRSYQVFTFLNKKYDYYSNDLGKSTLLIEKIDDQTVVQSIDVMTPPYIDSTFGENNSHEIYFDDLNFDGYEDMYMPVMVSGGKGYISYYAFIWDDKKQQFVEDETFTCFWYNHGYFAVDDDNERIIYGKDMTACESHFGIIKYQNGSFIETESLDITGRGNNNNIADYDGLITVYDYSVNGNKKLILYKKAEEELSEEEIQDNIPEFEFIKDFRTGY